MNKALKILFLEDSREDATLVQRELSGHQVVQCTSRSAFERNLRESLWDAILVDFNLPDVKGEHGIKMANQACPDTPVIIVTGSIDYHEANLACQFGARRFYTKDRLDGLKKAVEDEYEFAVIKRKAYRGERLEIIDGLSVGFAHDMNNVLGAIVIAGGCLRDAVLKKDWRLALEYIDSLDSAAGRGTEMTNQMTTFARGQNGSERKSVTAEYLLGELAQIVRMRFKGLAVSFRTEIGTAQVLCNPTEIYTALLNLCVNAKDAMPGGGDLHLSAQNRTLHDSDALHGLFVCFTVRDTGTGIPPEILPRIWEPFFTTKPQGKGTGLGLPLVKKIAEDHHGGVDVKTGPDGTTFYLYLPVATQGTDLIPKPNSTDDFDGRGAVILLVDDEAFFRQAIAALLENANYKVLSACNAPEALAHFRTTQKIDLLLTDITMPMMTGDELAKHLRDSGFNMPLIYMSGQTTDPVYEPVPAAVLKKPCKRNEILQKLSDVLTPKADSVKPGI